MFSCKFAAYFQGTFSWDLLWDACSGGCRWREVLDRVGAIGLWPFSGCGGGGGGGFVGGGVLVDCV